MATENTVEEVVPRMKTAEEIAANEGFLPAGVQAHHTEEEVAAKLFTVEVPEMSSLLSSWSPSSMMSVTKLAEKAQQLAENAKKSAEEMAENVKHSAEEIAHNVKVSAENVNVNLAENVQGMVLGETNAEAANEPTSTGSAEKNGDKMIYFPWEPTSRFSSEIRERVLRLPEDNNTFLVPVPAEVDFTFSFDENAEFALKMLEKDSNLKKKRFELVPRQIDENKFWRNYFYRVELIKKSYGVQSDAATYNTTNSSAEVEEQQHEGNLVDEEADDTSQEIDENLLEDSDSIDFDAHDNFKFEGKKGQPKVKESDDELQLSWEEELHADENFDMLDEEDILDDDDIEQRIKAELDLQE